jgi:hypothetical protein
MRRLPTSMPIVGPRGHVLRVRRTAVAHRSLPSGGATARLMTPHLAPGQELDTPQPWCTLAANRWCTSGRVLTPSGEVTSGGLPVGHSLHEAPDPYIGVRAVALACGSGLNACAMSLRAAWTLAASQARAAVARAYRALGQSYRPHQLACRYRRRETRLPQSKIRGAE